MEVIQLILGSPAGSFGFAFAILFAIGWGIKRITEFTTKWNMKESSINKIETKVDSLSNDMAYVKTQLNLMSSSANSLTQSHSPISLTDLGKKIAEEMNIETIISDNWENIFNYIDENVCSKNAYDIQQFCIETATTRLEKFFSQENLSKIKMFAYNAGKPLAFYGSMIGVIIRDKYFEQKGINPALVDKHTPSH